MSKKPPKHSELKKEKRKSSAARMASRWGRGRSTSPTIPIHPERILIVTEGEETERRYFDGFRERINSRFRGEYVTVKVIGLGDNTVSLFNRARGIAEADADGYTQVWVVYDKDDFPARDFNAVVELCASASGDGVAYRAAWTNEAFELWYILHFDYMDSALGRDSYEPKLSGYLKAAGLGAYEKARPDMFRILEGRMGFAIDGAKKLEAANHGKAPSDANPGTAVHKLVGELLPYIQERA